MPLRAKVFRKGKQRSWFEFAQMAAPLLPIPVGCYLLYRALTSFVRTPPPLEMDPQAVLEQPLYGEPVYQRVSFAPSTFMSNMRPRGGSA